MSLHGWTERARAYLKLLRLRTEYLIAERNWDCVEAVAEALLDRKALSANDVINIMQSTISGRVRRVPETRSDAGDTAS